ncbi:hypothetical protein CAPTEDRAFT_199341 [Capitella teleta]|uniref:Endonuclease/exonuclease/phosphatase domain-containing protein n=1 Tax=Capitella teleta TaxID=283909 RepID=R7TUN7_CAPTE|nr:hypothetical protein CAPTEDRAFT_199341 [Capitella teleta]|eukprot:ELT97282.1 hypothetical protein CAPTEDRAFT_199341 [Capitella teleta]
MPDDEMLLGRPYGGVAIMWRKTLCSQVVPIHSASKRVCVVKAYISECNLSIVIINCYMPCDSHSRISFKDVFLGAMDCVECILAQHADCSVVLAGDMNLDLGRDNAHDVYFDQTLERLGLKDLWCASSQRQPFTFCDLASGARSCIDHIAVSGDLLNQCTELRPHHVAINPSGHTPITVEIDAGLRATQAQSSRPRTVSVIEWHRTGAFTEDYRRKMDQRLLGAAAPTVEICGNCTDPDHRKEIDEWCNQLIDIALEADHVFPRKGARRRVICGWNDEVREFKDECQFWCTLWEQSTKTDHLLYEMMRHPNNFTVTVTVTVTVSESMQNRENAESSVTVYDPLLTSAWLSDTYIQHPHSQDSVPDEKDQPRTSRGVHEAAEELSPGLCPGARITRVDSVEP